MLACWHVKPETRPSFSTLEHRLARILGQERSEQYVELNRPYLRMNANRFGIGETDYLAPIGAASPPPLALTSRYVNMPKAAAGSSNDDDSAMAGNVSNRKMTSV